MFSSIARRSIAFGSVGAAGLAAYSNSNALFAKGVDYNAVREDVVNIMDDKPELGPTFVRLAWHASGTYQKVDNTGGSSGGTIRHTPECNHGGNAGLPGTMGTLESVKAKHPGLSYADLYTFVGKVAIEEMDGPAINWKEGRQDWAKERCTPDGRLPGADADGKEQTAQHLRDVFYRMGFNDKEIVALSGAHALGRCHTDRSGYWGPWTRAETTFSNEYFRLLVEEEWTDKKTHNGGPWTGPQQYEDKTGDLMMLPSDMALIWDDKFRPHVETYAKNDEAFRKDFASAFSKLLSLGCGRKKILGIF